MKTIQVTTKEFKKIPGYSTEISAGRWRGMIDTLIYELDEMDTVSVERQAWLREKGIKMPTLLIEMKLQVGQIERNIQFNLEPVLITRAKKIGGKYGKTTIVDEEKASWKLFHDLMRLKFTAARLGVVEVYHEFMPYISKQLPDGTMGTFADFMDQVMQTQGLEGLQLEHKPDRKSVDATVIEGF